MDISQYASPAIQDVLTGVPSYAATRIRQLERTPKAQLARLHVANGGQMGLPTYLKWSKDELVRIVAEDEGIDPWSA